MIDPIVRAALPILADMADQLDAAIQAVLTAGSPADVGVKAATELPILAGEFAQQVLRLAPAEAGAGAQLVHSQLAAAAAHLRSLAAQPAAS